MRCLESRPAGGSALRSKGRAAPPADAARFPASIRHADEPARRASIAPIPFIDVGAQRRRLGRAIDDAIARVTRRIASSSRGRRSASSRRELAAFCGARYAVGCASGTDALMLVLMAKGIGPGDAVICPTFTFCATAEVVALVGATPVFADVDADTFNLDAASLQARGRDREAARAQAEGGDPGRSVRPAGRPRRASPRSRRPRGLFVLDDAAQGFGATYKGRKLGTLAPATATSFFPAKPLGCYGDGGAVLTDDAELVEVLKSLRVHGQGTDKYDNVRIGMTARLDTIQAAVLIEKLKIFPDEIEARDRVARALRRRRSSDVAIVPRGAGGHDLGLGAIHHPACKPGVRDGLPRRSRRRASRPRSIIPSRCTGRRPISDFPVADGGLPVTERLADEVISLPMHAYLDEADAGSRHRGGARRAREVTIPNLQSYLDLSALLILSASLEKVELPLPASAPGVLQPRRPHACAMPRGTTCPSASLGDGRPSPCPPRN